MVLRLPVHPATDRREAISFSNYSLEQIEKNQTRVTSISLLTKPPGNNKAFIIFSFINIQNHGSSSNRYCNNSADTAAGIITKSDTVCN